MEILLLVFGSSFAVFFITMGMNSIIKRNSKTKFYFIGVIISFIIAFIGFWKIPINTENNLSNKNDVTMSKDQGSIITNLEAMDSQAVSSVIKNNPLNVSFINNGLNGAVLIQFDGKNILVDSGKTDNIKYIEDSLKGHSVKNIDSIILTTSDEDSIGAAADLIKNYNIKDIRYIEDSIKNGKSFKDIQSSAEVNNTIVKKIDSSYSINNAIISTRSITKGVKVDFKFPEDQYDSSIQAMSFVKDSFNNESNQNLRHSVTTSCDSLGNIVVSVAAYRN